MCTQGQDLSFPHLPCIPPKYELPRRICAFWTLNSRVCPFFATIKNIKCSLNSLTYILECSCRDFCPIRHMSISGGNYCYQAIWPGGSLHSLLILEVLSGVGCAGHLILQAQPCKTKFSWTSHCEQWMGYGCLCNFWLGPFSFSGC